MRAVPHHQLPTWQAEILEAGFKAAMNGTRYLISQDRLWRRGHKQATASIRQKVKSSATSALAIHPNTSPITAANAHAGA